jgi:hypothetical protein
MRQMMKMAAKISKNITIFVTFLIIFSAIIYYFYALNLLVVILSVIFSIISLIILNKYHFLTNTQETENLTPLANKTNWELILITVYLALLIATGLELILGRSDKSFISPWEMVNKLFFVFYFLSSLTLILLTLQKNLSSTLKLIFICCHYFLSLSVAVIVYKIGYGFDPFIHQAAMEIIDNKGLIMPKTPYYLGEYGLIISIHKLLGISIYFLNKFLVPVMTSLLLPGMIYKFLNSIKKENNNWLSFLETILILTFSLPLFIISTPQALSYIFIITAIISSFTDKNLTRTLLFSMAAAAIHPISGIPALIWSSWLIAKHYCLRLNLKAEKIISVFIFLGGVILLPLALFLISGSEFKNLALNFNIIANQIKEIFTLSPAGTENWLLNTTYFIFFNGKLLLLALIIIGIVLFYKKYQRLIAPDKIYVWRGLLIIGVSLIIAFILSGQISFKQLITYEQADYAKRLLVIATIFFMPFTALTIKELLDKIANQKEITVKIIWLFFGLIFISTSLYLAYPRFDRYFNSRGYSTSRFDLEAVKKIAEKSQQNYIVLANQQVSIAALKTLGFNHYYPSKSGLLYFYPIPTGGALYQYYLDMVYKNPDQKTMLEAMDLAGVNEAYLIINKYWNESDKIIEKAKTTSDSWEAIGGKEIFIFKYKR